MKVKVNSLIVLLMLLALSCQKEGVMIPEMAKVPLIKGVRAADQPQFEYIYNYSRLVSEEKSRYSFTNYNYNEQNQLVTTDYYINDALLSPDQNLLESALNQQGLMNFVNTELGGTIRYEYNASGQLVKAVTMRPSESTAEYSEYRYDDNDRIGREILYWDNNVLGYIDYLYDSRGNLISEALYSISSTGLAELNTTTQYEFDNKQNPFRSFQRLLSPGINTNPNNITKEIYTIHQSLDEVKDIVQVTSISYVYSSLGFPVRKNGTVEYLYE
jgi:YD repeat-containing protein